MHIITSIIIVLLITFSSDKISAQTADLQKYSSVIDTLKVKNKLSFISDDLTRGRLTGTPGSTIVSSYLRKEYERMGLTPFFSETYTQSFPVPGGSIIGRNIIGVIPSLYYSDEYIIISAHYDHLGMLGGRVYNGADDNASGVTALLTIAEMFSQMRLLREGPRKNIVFALYDAKESSMAGSEYFAANLPISRNRITYNINIDQIGNTFAPPGDNLNYILYVASPSIRSDLARRLTNINRFLGLNMQIDHTFYNSPAFYDIFFRTSDQYSLAKRGVSSIMFTSGIHMHTYKPTDVHYFINYPVFINRIRLIFYLADNLSRYHR